MAASDYGYYRSDGIQSRDTALRVDGDAYIYNSEGQIYPRKIETAITLNNGDFGGFTLNTFRTVGGWRKPAYQGAKSSTTSASSSARICYGHIIPQRIPQLDNLLRVEYCKIKYVSNRCGIHSIDRTLTFNVALNGEQKPSFGAKVEFTLPKNGDDEKTYEKEGGEGSALCNFMYDFLTRGNRLCLHNNETEYNTGSIYFDGTGYGSTNYASIKEFEIVELRVICRTF